MNEARYSTAACDAILLDWLDLPQQPDELLFVWLNRRR